MNVHNFLIRNQVIILALQEDLPQNPQNPWTPMAPPSHPNYSRLWRASAGHIATEQLLRGGGVFFSLQILCQKLGKVDDINWCHKKTLPACSVLTCFFLLNSPASEVLSCFFPNKKKVYSFGTEIHFVESWNICIFHCTNKDVNHPTSSNLYVLSLKRKFRCLTQNHPMVFFWRPGPTVATTWRVEDGSTAPPSSEHLPSCGVAPSLLTAPGWGFSSQF